MDCKICNPKTEDENVCENCMEINEGFRRHLQEITGYKLDHGWELNLNDFGDHVGWFLYGCYFGAKEPFAVDSNQVIRIDKPENTYRTDEELETEQKVTALQEEVAKAKNNLKISEEHSDAIVDGFDKLQKEVVRLDLALGIIRDLTEDGEVDADVINEIFRIADQSLPYEPKEQYENVTRFEVIDHSEDGSGRELVKHKIKVKLSLQDEGRTLKVFLEDR